MRTLHKVLWIFVWFCVFSVTVSFSRIEGPLKISRQRYGSLAAGDMVMRNHGMVLYSRDPDGSPPPPPTREKRRGEENMTEKGKGKERGKKSTSDKSLESRLNGLSFGYEGATLSSATARKPAVLCSNKVAFEERGCKDTIMPSTTLTKRTKPATMEALSLLPCFQDADGLGGSCPYVRLRCHRGHEWKAVPGSQVAMDCPICSSSSSRKTAVRRGSIAGKAGTAGTAAKAAGAKGGKGKQPKPSLIDSMASHAESKGGICLLSANSTKGHHLHWNSSVPFECSKGHQWQATVTNILKKSSWCAQCLADERLFLMQETAAAFGGHFLGFIEDISRHKRGLRYQIVDGSFGMSYGDFDASTGMFKSLTLPTPSVGINGGGNGGHDECMATTNNEDGDWDGGEEPVAVAARPIWPSSARVKQRRKITAITTLEPLALSRAVTTGTQRRSLSFSQSPAHWQCAEGHVFVQSSNNIRRRQGSARKSSWCPVCAKAGMRFNWEETAKEKSFSIKKKKQEQQQQQG